jgi:hypothetical protein
MNHLASTTMAALFVCALGCGGTTTSGPATDAAPGETAVDAASDSAAGDVGSDVGSEIGSDVGGDVGGGKGPAEPCATSPECASGLTCIDLAKFSSDGTCTSAGKACSKVCTGDGDCSSLTPGTFKCFAGCPGDPKFCGRTG